MLHLESLIYILELARSYNNDAKASVLGTHITQHTPLVRPHYQQICNLEQVRDQSIRHNTL